MVSPARLSYTATLVCVDTLLFGNEVHKPDNTNRSPSLTNNDGAVSLCSSTGSLTTGEYMLQLLETGCFTAVSEDILRRVIEHYPFRLTNQLFLALLPPYTREITLLNCKEKLTLMGLVEGLKKCSHIQRLNLQNCSQLLHADLFTLVGLMNDQLTSLILEGNSNITDEIVQAAIRALPNLASLNISCCSSITDDVFLLDTFLQLKRETSRKPIGGDYPYRLSSVDISGNSGITSVAVRHLTSLCGPNLRQLNLAWSTVDSTVLFYLAGYNFPTIIDLVLGMEGELKRERELRDYIAELKEIKQLYMQKDNADHKSNGEDLSTESDVTEDIKSKVDSDPEILKSNIASKCSTEPVVDDVNASNALFRNIDLLNSDSKEPANIADVVNKETVEQTVSQGENSVCPEANSVIQQENLVDAKENSVHPDDVKVTVNYDDDSFMYQSEIINLEFENGSFYSQNDSEQGENDSGKLDTTSNEVNGTASNDNMHSLTRSALHAAGRISGIINREDSKSDEDSDSVMNETSIGFIDGNKSGSAEPHIDELDTNIGNRPVCEVCSHVNRQIAKSGIKELNDASVEQEAVKLLHARKDSSDQEDICEVIHFDKHTHVDEEPLLVESTNLDDHSNFWDIANYCASDQLVENNLVCGNQTLGTDSCLNDHSKASSKHQGSINWKQSDPNSAINTKSCDITRVCCSDSSNELVLETHLFVNESAKSSLCDNVVGVNTKDIIHTTNTFHLPSSADTLNEGSGDLVSVIPEKGVKCTHTNKDGEQTVDANLSAKALKGIDTVSSNMVSDVSQGDIVGTCKDKLTEHTGDTNVSVPGEKLGPADFVSELLPSKDSLASYHDNDDSAELKGNQALDCDIEKELELFINNSEMLPHAVDVNLTKASCDSESASQTLANVSEINNVLGFAIPTRSDQANSEVETVSENYKPLVSESVKTTKANITNLSNQKDDFHTDSKALSNLPNNSNAINTQKGAISIDQSNITLNKTSDTTKCNETKLSKNEDNITDKSDISRFKPDETSTSKQTVLSTVSQNGGYSADRSCDTEKSCDEKLSNHRRFKPGLLSLDITNIKFVNMKLGQLCLKTFLQENPGLQKFEVSWKGLTEEFLKEVLPNLCGLLEVSLEECTFIQSGGLAAFLRECQQLRTINLRGVVFIKDMAMSPLYTMANLTKLNLAESELTDATLFRVANRCGEKLTDVDLSWCEEITEKGINYLCLKCTQLKSLVLRSCPVSNITLQVLSRNCPQLTELIIDSVEGVSSHEFSDSGLLDIAENLRQLQTLDISWNLSITNVSVSALISGLPKLKEVHMKGLKQITCVPFLPVISGVLDEKGVVKEFWVDEYCNNIQTASSLKRSTAFASEMCVLDLEYSDLVDDKHLELIVKVCRGSLAVTDYYGRKLVPDDCSTLVISSASVYI